MSPVSTVCLFVCFCSPVSIFVIITLNSLSAYYLFPFNFDLLPWFGSVLSFGRCFSVSSFCVPFCVCFYVLGKVSYSLALNGNSLMKKMSCSALQHSISCSPGPGTSGGISYVCCVCSALESWSFFFFSPVVCRGYLCLLWTARYSGLLAK